jgi:hypothetical protein
MKAQDLRIGNKIFYRNKVTTVNWQELKWIQEGNNNFQPIPLTEEWLLNFGFSTTDYKNGYIGIDHKAGGIITDFVLTYPLVIGEFQKHFIWEHSKFKYNELKYVHQLQNIFFALTNEELTINL